MRQGKTGLACTDGQNQWNSGSKKNAGRHKMKHMSFKRHNRHTFYRIPPSKTSPPKASTKSSPVYLNHQEWRESALASPLAALFTSPSNGLLQLSFNADPSALHYYLLLPLSATVCPVVLLLCHVLTFVCLALLPCLLSPLSVLFALLVCCYALLSSVCYCLPPYCWRLSVLLSGPLRLYCDLGLYKLN